MKPHLGYAYKHHAWILSDWETFARAWARARERAGPAKTGTG